MSELTENEIDVLNDVFLASGYGGQKGERYDDEYPDWRKEFDLPHTYNIAKGLEKKGLLRSLDTGTHDDGVKWEVFGLTRAGSKTYDALGIF